MEPSTPWIAVVAVLAVVLFVAAFAVLTRLVRTRRAMRRAGLPTGPRWVFWGAVLYFVLPTDLMPDPVYLDDIGVLFLALRTLRRSPGSGRRTPLVTESKETNHSFDSFK
ncbi:YkvA family protein [Streptomyces nigra]|uniref:YkvA family protein n=1 Tax=Streptomyces TaxID=1883 RepID=UPI000E1C7A26|nr:YkvA family protein [Streptomyces sp. M7]RDS64130.1 DUF1232 domain-containing protein [Streptomyces sp. M7]